MPAKPLTPEQKADADRLLTLFKAHQAALKKDGEPWQQDQLSEQLGMGQSAVSQYVKGEIPLNLRALLRFSMLLRCHPAQISPAIAAEERLDDVHWAKPAPRADEWRQLADEEIEKETDPDVVLLLKTFFRDIDERLKARQTIASAAANMRSKVNTSQPAAEPAHQK